MKKFGMVQGSAYYIGSDIQTAEHAHHALELVFALDKPFNLTTKEKTFKNVYGIIVKPNIAHRFIGRKSDYLFIFLEPELLQARQILDHFPMSSPGVRELPLMDGPPGEREIFNFNFLKSTLGIPVSTTPAKKIDDPRLEKITAFIADNLDAGKIKSGELAARIHLSESRFLHLFKEKLNLPVRKYILWLRLQKALMFISRGADFTESTHKAGFSDSAHFSRTFFKMFGVTPSSLFKR